MSQCRAGKYIGGIVLFFFDPDPGHSRRQTNISPLNGSFVSAKIGPFRIHVVKIAIRKCRKRKSSRCMTGRKTSFTVTVAAPTAGPTVCQLARAFQADCPSLSPKLISGSHRRSFSIVPEQPVTGNKTSYLPTKESNTHNPQNSLLNSQSFSLKYGIL